MTDPTHDSSDEPMPLVERLRNAAINLTTTYVAVDRNGDPIERPGDGSEEADFDDQLDPVEFEPEELHDLAELYREAARALEEMEGSIALSHRQTGALAAVKSAEETREVLLAILGPDHAQDRDLPLSMLAKVAAQVMGMRGEALATCRETVAIQEQALAVLQAGADPPSRAPLLAALEERVTAGATMAPETVEAIRDAIAAIRTDARVIEAAREKLKGWHAWARKIGRAEGDEYASAMPATLQARISGQVEAGQFALLVAPIRRRVEIVLALCADMGLGGPEAAELAPKAALWSDADVAEIEAFRVRDWSGTNLNPFDHLPPALQRTIYPGPGGRRAYLKRAGEPLPEPAERQLGLPGLPKPETAMRLRLALTNRWPDGPLELDAMQEDALWTSPEQADRLRRRVRQHVEKGDPRDVAAYCAFAWHHGWSLAQWDRHAHLDQVDRDILAAAPEDRTNVLLDGLQRHMEALGSTTVDDAERSRKREFFRALQDSETARDHHADLRYAMGHAARRPSDAEVEQTQADLQRLAFGQQHSSDLNALHAVLTSLLNAEPALDLEVFPVDPTTGEHKLEGEGGLEMAARLLTLARQRGAFDQRPAPSDPPSPPGYTPWISMGNSGWALDGVRVADDVIGAWAHYAGRWTSWARELAGCSDGTDEELRRYIARLVGRLHAMLARNRTAFDRGRGKPWAPAWQADPMGRVVFYADGRDSMVDRLMLRIDADGFALWVGDRYGSHLGGAEKVDDMKDPASIEIRTIEEVARLYPMVAASLDDYKADRLVPFADVREAAAKLGASPQ